MGLWRGLIAPWQGAKMIFNDRRMLSMALIPFFLNILLLLVFYYFGVKQIGAVLDWLMPQVANGNLCWKLIGILLKAALSVVLLLVLVLLYLTTAAIIAAPFNGYLSLMTERRIRGNIEDIPFRWNVFFVDIWRISRQEVRKLMIMLGLAIVSSLLNFIPLIGSFLYTVVNYGSLTFFTGMEYLDFPLESRRMEFNEKLSFSKKHFFLTIGIGTMTVFFLFIPMIFSFSTVGATKVYLEKYEKL